MNEKNVKEKTMNEKNEKNVNMVKNIDTHDDEDQDPDHLRDIHRRLDDDRSQDRDHHQNETPLDTRHDHHHAKDPFIAQVIIHLSKTTDIETLITILDIILVTQVFKPLMS